jgi:hypothetical protein
MTSLEDAMEERRLECARLLSRLTDYAGELLFEQPVILRRAEQFCPDVLASIWSSWEELGSAITSYIEGKTPWRKTELIESVIAIPGGYMSPPGSEQWIPLRCRIVDTGSSQDVASAAREFFVDVVLIGSELKRAA